MTKEKSKPSFATLWDTVMTESTMAHMNTHLAAHQAFVDKLHKTTGIYQWDLTYRERLLVALAIKTTLDMEKGK